MYHVGTVARCKRVLLGVLLGGSILFSFSSLGAGVAVMLNWAPTPDAGVAGYNVYYGNGSRNYQNQVPVGTNLSSVVSGLVQGKTYYFAVTAVDAFGVESDFSGEASYSVPGNQAPTISAITDQSGPPNQKS